MSKLMRFVADMLDEQTASTKSAQQLMLSHPDQLMDQYGLSEEHKAVLRARDSSKLMAALGKELEDNARRRFKPHW